MARPLRIQYPGAYYHVTCRGNERRRIFHDKEDYSVFIEKLDLSFVSFLQDFAARDREAGRRDRLQRRKPGQEQAAEQDGAGAGIKEKI